ncbi:alpha/beta-hydrolase [Rhizodiscina lignyota]|uniref:Alpha/beta-hydrolase n=1 Tax=Rhizodiscina lignyota TaxID=1504668 RepID=A0A9P4IBD1_9PEZI|nr:alpha/beta-hydrolase [Rhizodiscina lignyota]
MHFSNSFVLGCLLTSAVGISSRTLLWLHGNVPNVTLTNSTTSMYQVSSDSEFSFILERALAASNGGGAATGEVLRAAAEIKAGDFESWYREFKFLEDQLHDMATSVDSKRFPVSAREQHFHASTYYRLASFFLHHNASDPRLEFMLDAQLADFHTAIKLLPQPGEVITLDTKHGFTVPAYFFPAQQKSDGCAPDRLPTVITGTGYDGTQEDLYHSVGVEVLACGWNFISYEGPGQSTVRQKQNIGFIPEWWEVVTPVVDYLETRNDVDMDRVALEGLSYGGLLAPLAATEEHRIAAVLAIDGFLNLQHLLDTEFPSDLIDLFKSGNRTAFNAAIQEVYNTPSIETAFRWAVDQGIWSFDTADAYDWYAKAGTIFLDEKKLQQIRCPVFVGSGQDDTVAGYGMPEQMARWLGDKAYYHLSKTNIGAGEHCAIGAEPQLSMVTLDWLADVFDGKTGNSKVSD